MPERTVPERLTALRERMKKEGIDAYLVPTDDFHGSEYVGEHFKCRCFLTGFTGSAGTALVMQDMAGLWTDGRYFLQAEQQLKGSGITLFKMREENVPTLKEFIDAHLKDGMTLGFDGRTVMMADGEDYEKRFAGRDIRIRCDVDLVGDIWPERPPMSKEPVWLLKEEFAGERTVAKIGRVREALLKVGADALLLASLDDIAWLLNIRGGDVACNPVLLSYLWLEVKADSVVLYANGDAFSDEVRTALEDCGVVLKDYLQIYEEVKSIPEKMRVLLDPSSVNFALRRLIPEKAVIVRGDNPTLLMKAVKNPVEAENMAKAHVKDGAAVTRFIRWLKMSVGQEGDKKAITELSAAEKLEEFRRMGENYLGPSFEPIIAYREHAAIMHYSATEETNVPIHAEGMLLADTGGQYLEGTTDITRTIVLGPVSRKEKEFFTRVLRGHLNLAAAHFLYGCSGLCFDYLAREPLWEIGEDYNHGTGHGVGFVLNVHEGPNSFHYRKYPGRRADTVLEEGMVTSDEPGYYLPGAFGIRHENLILCKKAEKQPCGQFMHFEYLTMVPFDPDGILPEMMSEREKQLLNAYHALVREKLAPLLMPEENAWLEEATREI